MENINGTIGQARASADTVGNVEKERKGLERRMRTLALRAHGLAAPTTAEIKAADREGITVEAYCERACLALVAKCEEYRQSAPAPVVDIADAAE